jgi:hypothetical protein
VALISPRKSFNLKFLNIFPTLQSSFGLALHARRTSSTRLVLRSALRLPKTGADTRVCKTRHRLMDCRSIFNHFIFLSLEGDDQREEKKVKKRSNNNANCLSSYDCLPGLCVCVCVEERYVNWNLFIASQHSRTRRKRQKQQKESKQKIHYACRTLFSTFFCITTNRKGSIEGLEVRRRAHYTPHSTQPRLCSNALMTS